MSASSLESSPRLYEILGLGDFSSQEEVKKAYKQLALRYHPDKNLDDPSSADKFREVLIAYEVLSNTEKKKRYDISLKVHKATTGQYGRAAMQGAGASSYHSRHAARTGSAGRNPYASGNMNANIYEELSRQQQRRTGAQATTRSGGPRTAATGGNHSTSNSNSYGGAAPPSSGTAYTPEQQEHFRRRERERQAELKRQLERERAEAKEKEREAKRREQERQEELLQERWRQQQAAYAAAVAGGPLRSARRPAGGSTGIGASASARQEGRHATPPPSHNSGSSPSRNIPDLNFASNLTRSDSQPRPPAFRNSPVASRPGTPVSHQQQRSGSAVRRGGAAGASAGRGTGGTANNNNNRRPTPQRRGVSASRQAETGRHQHPHQSAENLSFQNFDGTPFKKARTPRSMSPTPSFSTTSATPPPPEGLHEEAEQAPRHSTAFPVNGGHSQEYAADAKSPPNRRKTLGADEFTDTTAPARKASPRSQRQQQQQQQQQQRRNSSLGGNSAAPFAAGAARRTASRQGRGAEAPGGSSRDGSGGSRPNGEAYSPRAAATVPSTRAARTAAALHTAKSSAAGQQARQHQRDLRAQEQEQELQRILKARQQLQKQREAAEAARFAADPAGYYGKLVELCALDEESEREQLIEKEEVLARRRLLRARSIDLGDILYGPAIQLLCLQEEDARAALQDEQHCAVHLVACGLAEVHNRLAMLTLEKRNRKQIAGKEATALYYVRRSSKVKGALVGQEAARRRALERDAHFKRLYLLTVMGPEFFNRMNCVEEEQAARRQLRRECFPAGNSCPSSPLAAHFSTPGYSVEHLGSDDVASLNVPATTAGDVDRRASGALGHSASELRTHPRESRAPSPVSTVAKTPRSSAVDGADVPPGGAGAAVPTTAPTPPEEEGRLTGRLPPAVQRALEREESRHRLGLLESEDAEAVLLVKLRANRLRGCHEREKALAVAAATRQAAKEVAHYKRRVAELERELAKAKADAQLLQQEGGSSGGGGLASPPMRVCTPSSFGESPHESDGFGEADAYLSHAAGGSGGTRQPPSSWREAAARHVNHAADRTTTTTATTKAATATAAADTGKQGKKAAAPSPMANSDDAGEGEQPPPSSSSPLASEARGAGGLNLARYFPRWREAPTAEQQQGET